jgi:hypothetical protein
VTTTENGWQVARIAGIYPDINHRVAGPYGQVEFSAERRLSPSGDSAVYAVTAVTLTLRQLNVRSGSTMDLVADNDTLALICASATGQGRTMRMGNPETGRGEYYLETLRYRADKDDLARIAFAGSVSFAITGQSDTLQGDFSSGNIEAFRGFYMERVH